jgi:hypothetical protein
MKDPKRQRGADVCVCQRRAAVSQTQQARPYSVYFMRRSNAKSNESLFETKLTAFDINNWCGMENWKKFGDAPPPVTLRKFSTAVCC